MRTLRREELFKSLTDLGLTKKQAQKSVDVFFRTITASLKEGKKVSIVGFGTWEWKSRAARKARNPKTGKVVFLRNRKTLVFKPSPLLKSKLQEKP